MKHGQSKGQRFTNSIDPSDNALQKEVERLKQKFREGRASLFPQSARMMPCLELLRRHTSFIDSILEEVHLVSCRVADQIHSRKTGRAGLAIIATGGYGRGELSPFSDVDISFIPSEEEEPWVEAAVHVAFKLVMDVFLSFREITVGYSYRPVSEAPTWDLATKTALLDARHICGNRELFDSLNHTLRQALSPLDLMLEVRQELEGPWRQAQPSLYWVEPNLKEGPGSLRDLHRGRWINRLLFPECDSGRSLKEFDYVFPKKLSEVQGAAEWFWSARNWLHIVTGRRSDVLITNHQDRIAREAGMNSAQEWLSRHYAHAESLAHFRERAFRRALEGPLDLGGVKLEGGVLRLRRRGRVASFGRGVRLFHLSQQYSVPVSLDDLGAIESRRAETAAVSEPSPEESWEFLGILSETRDIAPTLRNLVDFGFMNRFIEGFSDLMRFAPPDPAHSYTVGEHSLRIVEHLERLRAGDDLGGRRFSDLVNQCQHFDVLCLAALVHDAGKLLPGPDHSEAAMGLTAAVSERLRLAPEKREMLELLVRHHLLLVRTARLYDLKSASAIQNVAEKVKGIDALEHLYVFSYVDTHAVAEKNWTSMDYRDLEDLYRKVQKHLTAPAQESAGAEGIEDKIGLIRRRLSGPKGLDDEEAVVRHCDSMPAGYVLNTPLGEIVYHVQLLSRLNNESAVFDIYNRPGDDFSELTVCAYDDPLPGMLARITGVLYGCNVDIHRAQVFTMEKEKPVVLDTLWIRSAGTQISENRARRIRAALREIVTGTRTVEQFLKEAGKNPPKAIPLDSVDLRNDLSEEHTVVHVIARDLQGLLYLMTRTLSRSGLNIYAAKVATWHGRAENNFYVTTRDGEQIPEASLTKWARKLSDTLRGMSDD